MRRLIMNCFVLSLTIGSTALGAWDLETCSAEGKNAQGRAAYRRALEAAAPGTALYTPNVFPKSASAVIENFVYYHRNAFSDTPAPEMPPPDRRFFELLDADRLRFEVFRVENWNPLRCGPRKERAFYHVVRVFDRTTGEELLRASIEDNGHVARVRHKPAEGSLPPILSLAEVVASIKGRFGLQPRNLQYVAAWGTIRCDEVQPCVAFQDAAAVHLTSTAAAGAPIYRIDVDAKRLSMRRDLAPAQRTALLTSVRQRGQELVSLGFDRFSTATRVIERARP